MPRDQWCCRCIHRHGRQSLLAGVALMAPLGFLATVLLERRVALVVTDSGGVQNEAFLHGTPCVTVRRETEWVELLQCGVGIDWRMRRRSSW